MSTWALKLHPRITVSINFRSQARSHLCRLASSTDREVTRGRYSTHHPIFFRILDKFSNYRSKTDLYFREFRVQIRHPNPERVPLRKGETREGVDETEFACRGRNADFVSPKRQWRSSRHASRVHRMWTDTKTRRASRRRAEENSTVDSTIDF